MEPIESGPVVESGESQETAVEASTETTQETISQDTQSVEFTWKSNLDPDYAADKTIAALPDNVEGLKQFGKMFVHSQKIIGMDKVVIPGKNASPEDLNMFYNKLGRPNEPAGYELGKLEVPQTFLTPTDPNEAKQFNSTIADNWSKIFHDAGLTKSQAEKVYKSFSGSLKEMTDTMNAQIEADVKERNEQIYRAWGPEGSEEFERNKAIANRAFSQFLDSEAEEAVNKSGIIYDPTFQLIMHKVGTMMLEDNAAAPDSKGSFMMTKEKASNKLREIYADPSHPYFNRDNPAHKSAMEEVQRLFAAGGSF